MTHRGDPVRWLSPGSDAPEELRRVLSSAKDDGGGQSALSSLAAKLPVGPPAGLSAPAASGAVKKAILSWKLAVWVAGAAAAGGAVTHLVVLAPPTRPAITAPAQGISAAQAPAVTVASTAPSGEVASTGSEPPAPGETGNHETGNHETGDRETARHDTHAPGGSAVSDRAPPPAAGSAEAALPDSLGAEARLLLEARREMARDPKKALHAAETHDSAFSDGALAEEREVLRIEALVRLGKRDEAGQVAASFRARHPQSSHLARIEHLLRLHKPSAGTAGGVHP